MHNTAAASIDLVALRTNLTFVRKLCSRSRIMAMVKADAYGHGLLHVAHALKDADGFAVARLCEALALRRAGISHRILLLGTLLDDADLATCSHMHIDVTAHDELSVSQIGAQAERTPLRVWLKLDSGMHRLGLNPNSFMEATRRLAANSGVLELVHMTHFSGADETSETNLARQLSCFRECHAVCPKAGMSLANSAALIARPDTHADWVRPGIMLYGVNPLTARYSLPLRSVMTLRARVVAIREIGLGQPVGYNGSWVSSRPSRIGTLGIGYGDGYPRHAPNGTPVLVNDALVPLAGRVSMDSITVDLTDCARAAVGHEAVLWGSDLPATTIADHAKTIPYELFTAVTQRVTRSYLGDS